MDCYREFKLRYLKNLQLFLTCLIRITYLFEAIILQKKKKKKKKKKKRRVVALFKSIFLRNRFLTNARLFYGKITKVGGEICISLKIDFAERKYGVRWQV